MRGWTVLGEESFAMVVDVGEHRSAGGHSPHRSWVVQLTSSIQDLPLLPLSSARARAGPRSSVGGQPRAWVRRLKVGPSDHSVLRIRGAG